MDYERNEDFEIEETEEINEVEEPIINESQLYIAEVCDCIKLNIRALPDMNSEVVHILNKGDEVIVKGTNVEGWSAVEFGQYSEWSGYCLTKYLAFIPVEG